MASTVSRLSIAIGIDSSGLRAGAKQAESILQNLRDRVASLATTFGAIFGAAAGGNAAKWVVQLASDAQNAQVAFEVMLGSAEQAQSLLKEMREFANRTPFSFEDLQSAGRTLLAFGVSGEQVMPSLRMLGDVAGGDAEKLQRLSLAFGQIAAAGRLTGQDLLQLINAGFNPLQEISEATGMSMSDLRDEMANGNITFEMVVAAFQRATGEGGRFHGMMDKMAQTFSGQFAIFHGNVKQLGTSIGELLLPPLTRLLKTGSEWTKRLLEMDRNTARITSTVLAFGSAFVAAITLGPRIIAFIGSIIKAIRTLISVQMLQKALSGPAGWVTLAASLAVAAGAAVAVNSLFAEQEQQLTEATKEMDSAAESSKEMAAAQELLSKSGEKAADASDQFRKRAEAIAQSVRTPVEEAADKINELNQLVAAGALGGETYSRAMEKVREELFQATKEAKEFSEASRVEVGALTRNSGQAMTQFLKNQSESRRQVELAQKQLEVEQEQARLLAEANRIARERSETRAVEFR